MSHETHDPDQISEKPMIEQYADATHDAQVLQMVLKGYADNPQTVGLNLDQTIIRSIRRAEAEAHDIKERYEGGSK